MSVAEQTPIEVVEQEPTGRQVAPLPTHPLAIIDRAIERGIDADNLAKLMELQERWENRRAAEVYASALANFQADCPMVFKSRLVRNKDGSPRYHFASYDDIRRVTRPLESKWNISTTFNIEQTDEGKIKATCRVRVGSHFEDYTFLIPIPKGMGTNEAQDYGSALSYVKRYCYCAALNIVVTDEDTDGVNLTDKISTANLQTVRQLIKSKNFIEAKVVAWCEEAAKATVPSLEDVPAGIADKLIDMLRKTAARKAGAK